MQVSQLESFIERNWAACAALAYHNYLTEERGALVVRLPAPLDRVAEAGLKETLDLHVSYAPLAHFRQDRTYANRAIHQKVAEHIPEEQLVVIFLDSEGNFRLFIAEQKPTPVECFVSGADSTPDFTPVPDGALALGMKNADGGERL